MRRIGGRPGTNAYDDIGTVGAGATSLPPHTPPNPQTKAYWYRVKAKWSADPNDYSLLSNGLCTSADGSKHSELLDLQSPGPDSLGGQTWRVAQAQQVFESPAGGVILADSQVASLAGGEPGSASPHRVIGQSASVNPAVKIYFYHLDHLGSPRVITDVAGQVVSHHKYLPYGEELTQFNFGEDQLHTTNTHKFTGHERDAETGLDYMLARYYGPSLSRFITIDPSRRSVKIGNPQSWNRYTYARNNPLVFLDPDGESSLTYDGKTNTLTLTDKKGNVVGSWRATNNVQKSNPKGKWEDGTYTMKDQTAPHRHGGKADTPKGEYGSHGIFRTEDFTESNGKKRTDMGVHSGREGEKDLAGREGVDHATNGCIRTTEEAMAKIEEIAKTDPLETITVQNNKETLLSKNRVM